MNQAQQLWRVTCQQSGAMGFCASSLRCLRARSTVQPPPPLRKLRDGGSAGFMRHAFKHLQGLPQCLRIVCGKKKQRFTRGNHGSLTRSTCRHTLMRIQHHVHATALCTHGAHTCTARALNTVAHPVTRLAGREYACCSQCCTRRAQIAQTRKVFVMQAQRRFDERNQPARGTRMANIGLGAAHMRGQRARCAAKENAERVRFRCVLLRRAAAVCLDQLHGRRCDSCVCIRTFEGLRNHCG